MRGRKKPFIALFSLVVLIVIGVFTWTSFCPQPTAQQYGAGSEYSEPGQPEIVTSEPVEPVNETPEFILESEDENIEVSGTLHDYRSENGEYRQIHIENWGNEHIFVRIRLDEYMEIGSGAGLHSVDIDENSGESIANPQNLAKPLVDGASIDDPSIWEPHAGVNLIAHMCRAGFHDYWQWELGGQKYYFPAPEEYRANTGFVDTSSPSDLSSDSVNEAGVQARQTRLAQVWTMAQWITDGSPIGDFWVIDQDGWAYWASPLNPGESTGLLLNKITQITQPGEDYFYKINITAQMATKGSSNYKRFGSEVNGGWTSNGQALVEDIVSHTSSDIGIVVHRILFLTANNIPVVTYTATPSMGEIITEVSYSITTENIYLLDGPQEEFLYLAGDVMTAIGTLGTGTLGTGDVLFLPAFNSTIVFTVKDSAGNTANYTVYHKEIHGTRPGLNMAFVEPLPSSPTVSFVNNRVMAWPNSGISREQIEYVADSIGGRVIGRVLQRTYIIEVGRHTEEELREICVELMDTGLFSLVSLNIFDIGRGGYSHANDP